MSRITLRQDGCDYIAITKEEYKEYKKLKNSRVSLTNDEYREYQEYKSLHGPVVYDGPYRELRYKNLSNEYTILAGEILAPGEIKLLRLPFLKEESPSPLKYWRIRAGKSQTFLAKEVGISQPFLAQLESGKKHPAVSLLQKLSVALGVPLDSLVFPPQDRREVTDSAAAATAPQFDQSVSAKTTARRSARVRSDSSPVGVSQANDEKDLFPVRHNR